MATVTRSPIQVGFTLQESPGPAGTGIPVHVAAAQSPWHINHHDVRT